MYYPVCAMVHVKDLVLFLGRSSSYSGGSGLPLSLFDLEINVWGFYLTTHSTHFIYGYMASDIW